ncbi:hypothetical protein D3C85_1526710 [compost metagenome]
MVTMPIPSMRARMVIPLASLLTFRPSRLQSIQAMLGAGAKRILTLAFPASEASKPSTWGFINVSRVCSSGAMVLTAAKTLVMICHCCCCCLLRFIVGIQEGVCKGLRARS